MGGTARAENARLFVFERDVEGEDVAVFEAFRHVGVARTVVEDEALDEARVRVGHVLHLHQLDHVQIDRFEAVCRGGGGDPDGEDGVDDGLGEVLGEVFVDLGREARVRDVDQRLVVRVRARFKLDLELVQEGRQGVLGDFDSVCQHARVDALLRVAHRLLQEFADEEDDARRTVSGHFVLSDGGPRNQSGGGVLDLHLGEEGLAVFGHLELACAVDEHLEGAARSEVAPDDVGQPGCARHLMVGGLC